MFFFFFNDTATTEIYTLSLHALFRSRPRLRRLTGSVASSLLEASACPTRPPRDTTMAGLDPPRAMATASTTALDRKSTRLNSSHANISYAVFCLKKKNKKYHQYWIQL